MYVCYDKTSGRQSRKNTRAGHLGTRKETIVNLALVFSSSPASRVLLLGLMFVALKLAATALQIVMMRGDYRHTPKTPFFRAVYMAGKVTPSLAAACVCVSAILRRDWFSSWFFGLLAIGITSLALYVVRLRKQGRFFGLLDAASKRNG